MKITMGARWKSQVCTTEVVVTKAPKTEIELTCGGHPMVPAATPAAELTIAPDQGEGSLLGKRYGDDDSAMELLCTKAGAGAMAASGRPLVMRALKSLPSSD